MYDTFNFGGIAEELIFNFNLRTFNFLVCNSCILSANIFNSIKDLTFTQTP